jgi:hypothetical protein
MDWDQVQWDINTMVNAITTLNNAITGAEGVLRAVKAGVGVTEEPVNRWIAATPLEIPSLWC